MLNVSRFKMKVLGASIASMCAMLGYAHADVALTDPFTPVPLELKATTDLIYISVPKTKIVFLVDDSIGSADIDSAISAVQSDPKYSESFIFEVKKVSDYNASTGSSGNSLLGAYSRGMADMRSKADLACRAYHMIVIGQSPDTTQNLNAQEAKWSNFIAPVNDKETNWNVAYESGVFWNSVGSGALSSKKDTASYIAQANARGDIMQGDTGIGFFDVVAGKWDSRHNTNVWEVKGNSNGNRKIPRKVFARQTIKSYGIEFGSIADSDTKAMIQSIGVDGDGRHFEVTNRQELEDRLKEIIDHAYPETVNSGTVTPPVKPVFAVFNLSDEQAIKKGEDFKDNWVIYPRLVTDNWSTNMAVYKTGDNPDKGFALGQDDCDRSSNYVCRVFTYYDPRRIIFSYINDDEGSSSSGKNGIGEIYYHYTGLYEPAPSTSAIANLAKNGFGYQAKNSVYGEEPSLRLFSEAFIPYHARYHYVKDQPSTSKITGKSALCYAGVSPSWRGGMAGTYCYYAEYRINEFVNSMKLGGKPFYRGVFRAPDNSYRMRSFIDAQEWRFVGDILHSQPEAVNKISTNPLEKRLSRLLLAGSNDGQFYIWEQLYNTRDATGKQNPPYKIKLTYWPAGFSRAGWGLESTTGWWVNSTTYDDYAKVDPDASEWHSRNPHKYFVDGGIQWRTTSQKSVPSEYQQTIAAVAMGRGARGAFALNIQGQDRASGEAVGVDADESQWDTSVPLFETEKGSKNELGYTIGTPQIALTATEVTKDPQTNKTVVNQKGVRQLMFLSNGYQAGQYTKSEGGNAEYTPTTGKIYVYEAMGQEFGEVAKNGGSVTGGDKPGTLVSTIEVSQCTKGLATPRLVDVDVKRNPKEGIFDVIYVGDYCGDVYRVDLRPAENQGAGKFINIWQSQVQKIFDGDEANPITTQPSVFMTGDNNYVVLVGTGSDLYSEDFDNTDQQYFYGIVDTVDRSKPDYKPSAPTTLAQLTEQTIREDNGYRYITKHAVSSSSGNKGWKLVLEGKGERVVTNSSVLTGTVYFSTNSYAEDKTSTKKETCAETSKGGAKMEIASWSMAVDAKTGGAPTKNTSYFNGNKIPNDVANGIFVSGIKQSGLSSGLTIATASLSLSSRDPNGGGQSGEDGLDPGDNKCVEYGEYVAIVVDQEKEGVTSSNPNAPNQQIANSNAHMHGLEVPICKSSSNNRLVRINLKEVR